MYNQNKTSSYEIDNYRIEFNRTEKKFFYSEFGQFDITITFKDKNTGVVILQICTNEKRIYEFIINSYQYMIESPNAIYNERIWFDPNENGDRFIIQYDAICNDFPTEEDYSIFTVWQYNQYNNTMYQRLAITMNEYQIEDMIYNAWSMLEGLSYISKIGKSDMDDYLDFLGIYIPKTEQEWNMVNF